MRFWSKHQNELLHSSRRGLSEATQVCALVFMCKEGSCIKSRHVWLCVSQCLRNLDLFSLFDFQRMNDHSVSCPGSKLTSCPGQISSNPSSVYPPLTPSSLHPLLPSYPPSSIPSLPLSNLTNAPCLCQKVN